MNEFLLYCSTSRYTLNWNMHFKNNYELLYTVFLEPPQLFEQKIGLIDFTILIEAFSPFTTNIKFNSNSEFY